MLMIGKVKAEKTVHVYYVSKDWMIRKNRDRFWCRQAGHVAWKPGVPSGIAEEDAELLFCEIV